MNPRLTKASDNTSQLHIRFAPASSDSNPRLVRKTFLQTILAVAISILAPMVAHAGSATWGLNPGSGDWNTADNWTPIGVPNGPADIATFGLSDTTDISFSAGTEVNGITFTSAATNPYTITISLGFFTPLTISGVGITNNSGTTQHFVTAVNAAGATGKIVFSNSATAGSSTMFTNNGGSALSTSGGRIDFTNTSTAGDGTFINNAGAAIVSTGGFIIFSDSSTAANATFINKGSALIGGFQNYGATVFNANSTAANATFINNGGAANGAFGGVTAFHDSSSAGNATFTNEGGTTTGAQGGQVEFANSSSSGNATFINNGGAANGAVGGSMLFIGSSTAASGTFINNTGTASGAGGGGTFFYGGTAANGTFINKGATLSGAAGGSTSFFFSSTADNGIFINNGAAVTGAGAGFTQFEATSSFFRATAGNGIFTNNGGTAAGAQGGFTLFGTFSTAGSATLISNAGTFGGKGGSTLFTENSNGGTSRVEVFGNGNLDISAHNARGVTIGSLEGDGDAFLGANNLNVGSNNLSTTFSGVIQDGGENGGTGGSLTKIGSGTLVLSGANTYTGSTNVNQGTLQVDGSINGNAVVHGRGTLAGMGTVFGDVTSRNWSKVSPGDSPGVLTVVHNYTQAQYATLMIQIAGTSTGQFSVLNVSGNANLSGYLDPVLLNGFVPTIGQTFTFLDYASLTGEFSHIKDRVFDNGMLEWSVIYQNNNAILTVGPNTIPDQGSTFLLLTLGLLGLATYRRYLLRGQT
jgi:autotransporter-associated beta strand protein